MSRSTSIHDSHTSWYEDEYGLNKWWVDLLLFATIFSFIPLLIIGIGGIYLGNLQTKEAATRNTAIVLELIDGRISGVNLSEQSIVAVNTIKDGVYDSLVPCGDRGTRDHNTCVYAVAELTLARIDAVLRSAR